MKIRNGFVSNSSSSSFVILGFKSNESIDEDIAGKFDSLYVEYSDADYITGYIVADGDPYDGSFDGSIDDLPKMVDEIAEFFDKDPSEIKLYCGIRPC